MNRTDLIEEQRQSITENISGIRQKRRECGCCEVVETIVESPNAALRLNRKMGRYITLTFPPLGSILDTSSIFTALKFSLKELLPTPIENVLVVGLGNTDITPDALGPFCANRIFATRHLKKEIRESLGLKGLKNVSVLIPGVLGKTGIEASKTVAAVVDFTKSDAVIAIDALAAADIKRVCTTLQLSNTGISPGSGVENKRKELSCDTLGVPVIAIGMPTVIDAFFQNENSFMMTPKDIDLNLRLASNLISDALNSFLQPDIDEEILKSLS